MTFNDRMTALGGGPDWLSGSVPKPVQPCHGTNVGLVLMVLLGAPKFG